MKKVILLVLPAIMLAGCSVKDRETEITVFRNTVPAVYTGKVKRKIPNGEGSAVLEQNAVIEGVFEQGTWISGKAENVPYSISYGDQMISGSYTGEVSEELPSGSGAFESDEFSFDGTWIAGAPEGPGTVTAESFRINTPQEVLEGSYSGEINKGLAEGNGTFVYQTGEDEIQMEGTFAGNMYEGLMFKTIRYRDTVKSYPVYYQKGQSIDSAAAMIAYLEGMRNESYCLSEAQFSFLTQHSALFEGKDTAKDYDSAFDYESFAEGSDPALVLIPNAVIKSVQRYKPYSGADTVTSMIVQNNDGWYHLVFAYSVDDADTGDYVNICALPLCRSTLTAPEQDYPAIDAAGAGIIG